MELSNLFEIESYSNYKCVIKSSYLWSVGNSQRAVDNVQTVAKPTSIIVSRKLSGFKKDLLTETMQS